jgi:hypothetical protein
MYEMKIEIEKKKKGKSEVGSRKTEDGRPKDCKILKGYRRRATGDRRSSSAKASDDKAGDR